MTVLNWLLAQGADVEEADDLGHTPLMMAAGSGMLEAVEALLSAGANANRGNEYRTPLSEASTREVALRLLEAGADPQKLSSEGRRLLLHLSPEPDEDALLAVSPSQFRIGWARRFGAYNPELMQEPFWLAMIQAGVSAYHAWEHFEGENSTHPVWCANRFGQSITLLPDGRIVQVAGEHEDFYDLDFCIYNDVFVHEPDGTMRIYGYPAEVFPPTDFHTATLIGDAIYLIGSLGYTGSRRYGMTPVYRLDTQSFRIEPLETGGEKPGWIYEHRAQALNRSEIAVWGGKIGQAGQAEDIANAQTFVLDLRTMSWRRE
jgi:hypothetical protein